MDLSAEEVVRANQLNSLRLLCELPFGQNDIDQLRQTIPPMGIQAWHYPTLAAMVTVGLGIYYYNEGDFWSVFPSLDSPIKQSRWGQHFEDFLVRHNSLETFRSVKDEGGHRYVGPILAHGGIPQSCLPDFFSLITNYGDREQTGQDLIASLKESPGRLVHADKPVQRFIRYGGEVAESFVTRCLALWQCYERGDTCAKCGLPDRVIEKFSAWWPLHRPARRDHVKRLPRPELYIEPAGLGVFIYLPRCDDHPDINPNAHWHVLGKDWAVTRAHEIPVAPSNNWKVTREGSGYTLNGPPDEMPMLFFDPNTGKAISEPSLRRLPAKVWALIRGKISTDPLPILDEEFSRWPGYYLFVFDLTNNLQLRVGDRTFDVRRPFFHCEIDPLVPGVQALDETPVFNVLPEIRWEGKANLSLSKDGIPRGNIDIESAELPILLDTPGKYLIELCGPLGENIRKHFVYLPRLIVQPDPRVMWPNQRSVTWNFKAEAGNIRSRDRSTPFTSYDSIIDFTVEFADYRVDLLAKVPRLSWRLLAQHQEKLADWSTDPISVYLSDLAESDYPLLECTFGSTVPDPRISLLGRRAASRLEGKQQRRGDQSSWYFDLRAVRDVLEASGQSEEFDLIIESRTGYEHYRGKILSVRPHWDLRHPDAHWKKQGDQHVIHVAWNESGKPIVGRWLIVIPLWRPWEGAILQHDFNERERNGHTWRLPLSDLMPGRYVVKAVHAPWNCDDWIAAQAVWQKTIDVYKESWPQTFVHQQTAPSVDLYLQSLLAHWYHHQLVAQQPLSPSGLTCDELSRVLDGLKLTDTLEPINLPKNSGRSLDIFTLNPVATTEVYRLLSGQRLPDIWRKVLPPPEVITLELNENDQMFVGELAFQYTVLGTAARHIRFQFGQRALSGVLAKWHRNLVKEKPPVDEVIFLCEKFHIFDKETRERKREYEQLKTKYQSREAV
jgi:hypothetical protein